MRGETPGPEAWRGFLRVADPRAGWVDPFPTTWGYARPGRTPDRPNEERLDRLGVDGQVDRARARGPPHDRGLNEPEEQQGAGLG